MNSDHSVNDFVSNSEELAEEDAAEVAATDVPPGRGRRGRAREDSPYRLVTVTSEPVPDEQNRAVDPERSERFRELAKRSHAARRANAKKAGSDPRTAIDAAMKRKLETDPDSVVEALLKSPRGVEVLLAHGAGLLAEQKSEPPVLVLHPAFAVVTWRKKPGEWLRLLDSGNIRQLRAELVAHSEEA
jgi:hypothetical protein